jgi:hypothetical protein
LKNVFFFTFSKLKSILWACKSICLVVFVTWLQRKMCTIIFLSWKSNYTVIPFGFSLSNPKEWWWILFERVSPVLSVSFIPVHDIVCWRQWQIVRLLVKLLSKLKTHILVNEKSMGYVKQKGEKKRWDFPPLPFICMNKSHEQGF